MSLLPEPPEKETKPAFTAIPPALLEKIAQRLGARVTGGDVVYGGFSAAANFALKLDDGRRVFAKGSHPGDDSHAVQTLRQDIDVYEKAPVLRDISPRFLGAALDGDEDGWALGLWDYIDRAEGAPDLPAILVALKTWQSSKAPFLKNCREQNYISGFFSDEKKWRWIAEDARACDRFLSLFSNRGAGEDWLDRNLQTLLSLQGKIADVRGPAGPLHGDLRLDNVFQDKRGKVYIVDWPNACLGPRVFDLLFLGASLEAQGLGRVEDALVSASLSAEERRDARIVAAVLAGYFADQAGRAVPPKLPRLRWMQKGLLGALLAYLAREEEMIPGNIDHDLVW